MNMSYEEFEQLGPAETAKLAASTLKLLEGERDLQITLAQLSMGASMQKRMTL